jgi:glycosyltransferase involved in cell wall biosynthesis
MKNKQNEYLKIAIDGNEANIVNRVGSNVYAFEILNNLHHLTKNKKITVTILLSTPPVAELPPENKGWRYKIITPAKFWTRWALPVHLFLHPKRYDVFFTPGHYAPRLSSIPYVSSVMDLAFIHYPDQFKKKDLLQLKNWTKYSALNAKKIVTISQFSRQDIVNSYHRNPADIVVAYPSVDTAERKAAPVHTKKVLNKFKIKEPYILYIGTIQPRKNLTKLVEAFEKASRRLPFGGRKKVTKLQLVLAGKVGWLADDLIGRIEKSPFKKNIITTGFVSDFEKQVLLENASCLGLIGLYEGFGIPALEALEYGVIPVVSNTSSLPEVVGEAGFLVDPNDSSDISRKIEDALSLSARKKAEWTKLRKEQIVKFDWRESAKIILKTLEGVARDEE